MNENVLGIVAGILTSVSMIPQLIKVLKDKNVNDLSWVMLLVLITGVSLWVWYGVVKDEWPIILSNAFSVMVNISLLICYMLYKKS
ncbi:SemiSWEET transporter [Chryseobacterium fluminis]|uniref:SemiSWEET transporter n=1 Tax=Chryseobacterium fluminis TaxID=2983606 RepID=UPI00225B1C13|nr:SemiSWEET transporter [Chryseobacterium sp. MMS21-Ot14]UZT97239.1 SemiSWEET transporter [Chryseobacterium sp. MMS21-Ot14]